MYYVEEKRIRNTYMYYVEENVYEIRIREKRERTLSSPLSLSPHNVYVIRIRITYTSSLEIGLNTARLR